MISILISRMMSIFISISAVPELSNFSIPVMMPRDAMTVPPGTPGAPMAKIPRRRQNRTMVPGVGTEPYRIFEIAIQKKTSVRTEPQRWMFANRGIPKLTRSLRSGFALEAHCSATASVSLRQSDRQDHNGGQPPEDFLRNRFLQGCKEEPSR